ncbi:hypothetical protein GBAR_LOCUS8099 [Geodia barretti]|nr:hypothetical protein GBAR_LOCUS8099 [Geodia barretti]
MLLTLDEVHEVENISHAPPLPLVLLETADHSAFNDVAVLQSSGAIQDEPPQPPLPHKLPRPPVPLTMPHHHRLQDYSMSGRLGGVGGRGGVEPGSFGYMLEKEMRFDEDFAGGSSSSSHLPLRGIPPMALHHHRDPHLPNSSLLRDAYGQHAKPIFPTPHPHQAPPMSGRPSTLHDKWAAEQRSWIHPETGTALDYGGGLQRPPVDHIGLPMMHPHAHPHHSGIGSRGVMGRPSSQSWAIEMEQRRRVELQSMREREARERGASARERLLGGGDLSLHHQGLSKPNISLLPTAVMRQLHNSNPAHSLTDIASRSSQASSADRMDQDMSGRSAYPHSAAVGYGYPEGLSGGRTEYPYPTAHSRIPQRPQHRGGMGLYAPPPQYLPIPHGMSSQQQNPYLH